MSCSLEVKDLAYKVDGKFLFQNVNFKLGHKDKIGIIGPNGAGKTTLLRIIAGLKKPFKGEIYFYDKKIENEKDYENIRPKLGFLFQDPEDQLIYPTVIEDIAFGLINSGLLQIDAKKKSEEMLERMGISHLKDKITFRLSGGEKKLVALAGILITEPDILLLDEPSTALDEFYTKKIIEILQEIKKTILIVSHDFEFTEKIVDNFFLLSPDGLNLKK